MVLQTQQYYSQYLIKLVIQWGTDVLCIQKTEEGDTPFK